MAPIRKGDGAPLEIPGVQEVRSGDGRVFFEDAIPDTWDNYYDAADLSKSDQESISSLSDLVGETDLSGDATFVDEGANGNPSISFNGSDEFLEGSFSSDRDQPNTIFGVVQWDGESGNARVMDTANVGGRNIIDFNDNDGELQAWAGTWLDSGESNITDAIILGVIFDGGDSEIRVNGSTKGTGNLDLNALGGINIGDDGGGFQGSVSHWGSVNGRPDIEEIDEIEGYLSDESGIPLND